MAHAPPLPAPSAAGCAVNRPDNLHETGNDISRLQPRGILRGHAIITQHAQAELAAGHDLAVDPAPAVCQRADPLVIAAGTTAVALSFFLWCPPRQ